MRIISFVLLFLLVIPICAQENTTKKYYRHLMYNHVSPHVEIRGTYEITEGEAQATAHYRFTYNSNKQLVEIINHNYYPYKRHPLGTIGAHRTSITYDTNTETRIFFDINGKRMTNDRGVYKEVYTYNKKGFKYALDFYDENDNLMESNWNIANYRWSQKGNLVIEKRYDLSNSPMPVSPYFEFGFTGIKYKKDGTPQEHFNLGENLKIKDNTLGIASYRDTYDKQGNHIQFSYYDAKGELTKNPWDYAVANQMFDENGYISRIERLDENKKIVGKSKFPPVGKVEIALPASSQDSLEIRKKSLGYLIALQELKPDLMSEVFHPKLAKRTIGYDRETKQQIARETTYEQMIEFANSWNQSGNKFPPKPMNKAIILDIYDHIATVKLVSDNWVEYLQLMKSNGEWSIINLLWQYRNVRRYTN